jgi:hypothetical protein
MSQTAPKLSNTHNFHVQPPPPPTRSFPDNLCQVHTFFSHLFHFYLLLSCLRILAFHHSLWFITIIPDTRRPLPELCSFECCVPTVLSEHKSRMMLSLLCLSSTSAQPHAHTELFLYLFVRTYNSKQPRSDSVSLRSNRLPYSPKALVLLLFHQSYQ